MRTSTTLLTVLVAILSVTSLLLWRQLRNEQSRAAALQTRIEAAREWQPAAPPGPATVATPTGPAPEAGEPKAPSESQDGLMYDESRYYQDKTFREAQRRLRLLNLTEGHVDIAKALGITQKQADQLLALLVEQELRYLSKPHRNPRNEEELQARRLEGERLRQQADAEVATIIGERNLSRWHDYQASLAYRHQVRELGLELADGGNPLREDQVEPLVAIIYKERMRAREELAEFSAGLVWTDGMEAKSHGYRNAREVEVERAADERIRAAAGGLLSADQLDTLLDRIRRDRELQNARSEARRAWGEAHRLIDAGD